MNNTNPNLATLKLTQAWETLIVPQLDEITERTSSEYRDCLSIWSRLSGNPDVSSINRDVVKGFRDKLISTPFKRGKTAKKRSAATVNRIMRDLHVIVSPLWPADRVNPGGIGVTPIFKWPRQLDHQRKLPFVFQFEHLDQLYRSCDACEQTPGCRTTGMNNPRHWRTALVLALNCGARTWDLFGLRWPNITLQPHGYYEFGSVLFQAVKTKKLHRIPLNQCAAMHLADLAKFRSNENTAVFTGFKKGRAFYSTWKRICDAANVAGTFESMRKTCVTFHNDIVPEVGFWLTGHVRSGVTGHYDNPTVRIMEAVYKLRQPSEFAKGAQSLCT